MHVLGHLPFGEMGQGEGVKVVHSNLVFGHDFGGDGVVFNWRLGRTEGIQGSWDHWGGGCEDEFGTGLAQFCDDFSEVCLIVLGGALDGTVGVV